MEMEMEMELELELSTRFAQAAKIDVPVSKTAPPT
jgi:hypothetical protein